MVASASTRVNASGVLPGVGSSSEAEVVLGTLAERALFAPLRGLLRALPPSNEPPPLAQLNALWRSAPDGPPGHGSFRFVPPDGSGIAYEQQIVERREIVTRACNWHDFFNALVWLRFPRAKHCLARLHADGLATKALNGYRGPLRDAATQFDESGIVALSSSAVLLDLLQARQWKELFWVRRAQVREQMRFLVFGHGLYDALRAPFYRICGRAAAIEVSQPCIEQPVETQCARADAILAERFAGGAWYPRPKALLALPLLGIPGVCADSEQPEYYEDPLQFRPPP